MSFKEVLERLPLLSIPQRHLLIRRALELDEQGLPPEDEALVENRLRQQRVDPASAVPLAVMKKRVRTRRK